MYPLVISSTLQVCLKLLSLLKAKFNCNESVKCIRLVWSTHLCAAKQHKIRVFCYDNLHNVFQVKVCKLCICLIRSHNAVHITATTLVNQCECHFMCYINTSPQKVSGFICPSSPKQFSCPLPTALTRSESICQCRIVLIYNYKEVK